MKKLSIQTHLLLLVMAVSVPLVALVGYSIYYDMHQVISRTKSSLRVLMEVMVHNTEATIADAHHTLAQLAARPIVKEVDAKHCDPALKDLHSVKPSYANILYTDLNGIVVCSALPQPDGKLVNNVNKPWFKEFMQRQRFTISEPYRGVITGKMVSIISMPIRNARNEMIGGIHLPLDLMAYDPHIPAGAMSPESRYGFFTESGVMIWRNLDPENVIGTHPNADAARKIVKMGNGDFEGLAIDGVTRYFVVMKMPKTGWIAFVGVPADTIYAKAKHHAILQMASVLVLIGLMCLLALAIARRISAPIMALAKTAHALHGGDFAVRAAIDGPREIAAVALELNEMITAQQRYNAQLRASESRYDRAINGANDGIWEGNIVTNEQYLSPRWKQLLGYQDHELPNVAASFSESIHHDDKERVFELIRQHFEERTPFRAEMRMRCKNGEYRWYLSRGQAIWDEEGKPISMAGSMADITERKLAENDLRIAAIAFESQEGMTVAAADGTILRVNRAFSKITGYSAEEIVGQNPRILQSGRHDADFYCTMWVAISTTGTWEGEIWNRRKNGEIYPEYLIITAVKDQNGIVTNYVATFNDITNNKAAADEIMNLAFYDPLTLLPNRRLLLDRIKQALAASTRSGQQGSILFIDLDHFKNLNDTLGHNMGDSLLQQVAKRLVSCVRESDTVARLGGDEFVVMLEDLSADPLDAAAQCEAVGKKILAALNQPYLIGEHEHRYGASIGATLFNGPKIAIDELLQQSDIAMYQAKSAGRNLLCFFDPKMQTAISDRAALENELHKVLENRQFCLYYQIQVDSALRPLGAEALLRWIHPERGLISPSDFIPIAEETDLILPIGQWVLETACAQLKQWEQDPLTRTLVLAVNVSAKQFRQFDFVARVRDAVLRHAINPLMLKLELTESMLFDKIEETIATINNLKELGIQFSLDDFGTGYSSLQYLKRLPLNQLKIDQSFVRDLADNSSDKAIVRTIIAMAHSLGLDVIAEGVETEQQRDILANTGCKHYQGYLFGKPMPIEQLEEALMRQAHQMQKYGVGLVS